MWLDILSRLNLTIIWNKEEFKIVEENMIIIKDYSNLWF